VIKPWKPGLYTAAVGHHFARPGNRFWPALHAGGFTDRVLSPFEERELLKSGYGITNVVARATASADLRTSGLNANYQAPDLARLFRELRNYAVVKPQKGTKPDTK
jgi:double-stranded uracil-DNA glycosylase